MTPSTHAEPIRTANIETLSPQRVLAVDNLSIAFRQGDKAFNAVRNLSFTVDRGETLAIVGESGSGKSVTSLALMRLIEHGGGRVAGGSIVFRRRDGSVLDLARAWALVSTNPARAAGLPDRGVISPGMRADLVVVDANVPQVVATFAAGQVAFLTRGGAQRLDADLMPA